MGMIADTVFKNIVNDRSIVTPGRDIIVNCTNNHEMAMCSEL